MNSPLVPMRSQRKNQSLQRQIQSVMQQDPVESAKMVGLRYVTDQDPGIQRRRVGRGFQYLDSEGEKIQDTQELERIKALGIPPAWKDVWICTHPQGHLQATGRDAKGRKQYRYHSEWRNVRDQTKFARMLVFSEYLPQIRERVTQDCRSRGLSRQKVLATIVQLMELTQIRVGNEEYARTNQSFGLTTMQDEHVEIQGSKIHFQFRGKSGVEHDIEVRDRRLAKIVKQCQDIPGQELFQYFNEDGEAETIDSEDVNAYLQAITEQDFTAKDFRTWGGTVAAVIELAGLDPFTSKKEAQKNVSQVVKCVASNYLGNRPATCRKYYIHPAIFEAYVEGTLLEQIQAQGKPAQSANAYQLSLEERVVVEVLKSQFRQDLVKGLGEKN